jgi:hypothetical protein
MSIRVGVIAPLNPLRLIAFLLVPKEGFSPCFPRS